MSKPTEADVTRARDIVEMTCGTQYWKLTGGDFKAKHMSEERDIAQALADAREEFRVALEYYADMYAWDCPDPNVARKVLGLPLRGEND